MTIISAQEFRTNMIAWLSKAARGERIHIRFQGKLFALLTREISPKGQQVRKRLVSKMPQPSKLTNPQREEVDRRLEDYRQNPDEGTPWKEVKRRVTTSLPARCARPDNK